jgi:hypothetical protein
MLNYKDGGYRGLLSGGKENRDRLIPEIKNYVEITLSACGETEMGMDWSEPPAL